MGCARGKSRLFICSGDGSGSAEDVSPPGRTEPRSRDRRFFHRQQSEAAPRTARSSLIPAVPAVRLRTWPPASPMRSRAHLRRSAIATIYCSSTIAAMENRLRCNATLRPRQLGRRRFERRTCRARLSEARAVWRIVRYDVLSRLRSSPSGDRRECCPPGRRSAAFLHPPTADGARSADGNRPARTSMRPRSNLLRALLPFRRPFCGVGAALQRWSDQPRRYRVTSLRKRADRQIVKNRAASVRRFRGLRETLGRRCSYFLLGSSAGLT